MYKRWEREAPMHLWQLDLVDGIYLAEGRECKMLTGIDDHSRFIVAAVLAVPPRRAVADAFLKSTRVYGVSSEVLTDNGKQFTGRFAKPRPAEVLFERVCREDATTVYLGAIRGPADRPSGDQCVGAYLQPSPPPPVVGHGQPSQPVPAERRARRGRRRPPRQRRARARCPPVRSSRQTGP
jgi:hypothetical protein